jgi:hypothetical protein
MFSITDKLNPSEFAEKKVYTFSAQAAAGASPAAQER